jgi:hypothetical protein
MKLTLAFFLCVLIHAELLDRVAVSIGTQVITESQIIEEIKLNSFLNHEPPNLDAASKRAAADRLIEQKLVRKEMALGRYPGAATEEAGAIIQNLLKTRATSPADFDVQLKSAGISLAQLQEHLLWGLTLSHFIDLRFRPAVQVTDGDVTRYFQEKVLPASTGGQKPTLDNVRGHIEETLRAARSDAELDAWLKDTRAHTSIHYQKEVFGEDSQK